jgi:signal transduction histidine kinase
MHLANITVQQIIDALPEPVQVINSDFSVDLSNNLLRSKFVDNAGMKCHEKFGFSTPCPACPIQQALLTNSMQSVAVIATDKRQYSVFLFPVNSGGTGVIEVVRLGSSSSYGSEAELLEEETRFYSDKIGAMTTAFFGMAHNLKNPLTAIQGKIQIFGMRHPEFKSEVETLLLQCDSMTKMLGEITQKFRLEQSADVRPIDVNNLVENELRFINLDLNVKHKIQKKFIPAESLPPVLAVYSDLSMALSNILKNAIASISASDRKYITITTALDDGNVVITVEDTGCGISKEDLPRIFVPFYSCGGNGGNGKQSSRGLGLFIVYQLVHKYDGKVDIESSVGIGTKVILKFPAGKPVELTENKT